MATEPEATRKSIGARRSLESAEAILEAAEAVLIENGYSGFSIEAVARRARAGKPTIYRWWSSKTALLLEVYQRQKRDITYSDTGAIEEDLFIFAKSLFSQWRDTPAGNIFRSLVAEAQQDPAAAEALAEYSAGRRAHTGKLIERAKARGEVAADIEPSQIADMVSSYAWVHLLTGRLDEDDATLRKAIRVIVHGIKA
ncbi:MULTISPECIES: TetR/AcrR family transcriptional regulator [Hyphomicrobiales]|uniref:TetR/AcrR family transcriptional regulator n=1 Tax=Hyphomicrobiales TaxID=356 RepID=UPI00037CD488|nr:MULTISPECIES: TetR/AcrR family transcriptional regulator [Phyllobacteriaceae]MCX8567831.1 TetR/AcrR family transcriptional regulator [Aminobacter sp. MET-1]